MAECQPCNPHILLRVIWETKPRRKMPIVFSSSHKTESSEAVNDLPYSSISKFLNEVDSDEVYPGIFIGDESSARNIAYLRNSGITHVVNTAQGHRFAQVDTDEQYYSPFGIKFLGLKLMDTPETKISPYFNECADFIDDALKNNGKVLVHCFMGISRSSTIVLAYLMLRKNLSAEESLRSVRQHRDISPNNGFLQQLCDLENSLRPNRLSSL